MKTFFITLFLTLPITFFAQGNLQFNRVVTFSDNNLMSQQTTEFETITIPPGKVWKIESVALTGGDSSSIFPYNTGSGAMSFKYIYARFNDIIVFGGDNTLNQMNLLPVWLNPGTYSFKVSVSCSSCAGGRVYASYSALEFNVISN